MGGHIDPDPNFYLSIHPRLTSAPDNPTTSTFPFGKQPRARKTTFIPQHEGMITPNGLGPFRESGNEDLVSEDDIIRPTQYEDVEDEYGKYPATGPEGLSSIKSSDDEEEQEEQEEQDEREAWVKARREQTLQRKRRLLNGVQKRTLSQSIGSDTDDEDLEPFDAANDAGSNARRLRRTYPQSWVELKFGDPPAESPEVPSPIREGIAPLRDMPAKMVSRQTPRGRK